MITAVRTRDNACLACGKRLDAATAFGHTAPLQDGNISVCISCGHIALFTADGRLRNPTADELVAVSQQPDVKTALWMIAQTKQHLS